MIFNEFGFLFLFLPLVFAVFLLTRGRIRFPLLIAASLVFYGMSGVEHAVVLAAAVLWVWLAARSAGFAGSRLRLTLAVVPPLGALVYYKYSGFLIANLGLVDERLSGEVFLLFGAIALPAGISFFTFQLVSFAIDRYRGQIERYPKLGEFALYVSFFPQLVAGPILRYSDVERALARLGDFLPARQDYVIAIGYVCFGFAAKVLLADSLSNMLTPLSRQPGELAPGAALYVVLAYSFQIYFDFYGYSLIAIGLGRLFGFHFPDNFLRPYESDNPRDFWRRWHVTLSFWIRDYLYMPLGGNARYVRNIFIIFAACGLWHGAGWSFIAWGLYHALLVTGYSAVRPAWDRLPRLLQRALNFTLVSLGWLLFLYDFQGAGALASSLLGFGTGALRADDPAAWTVLLIAAAACFLVWPERAVARMTEERRPALSAALAALLFLSVLFFDQSNTFIYFRF